jgi:hypothetical protein
VASLNPQAKQSAPKATTPASSAVTR